MSSSPDKFHKVREIISDTKAKNESLHLMELKSHLSMLNEYDDQILSHFLALEKCYKASPQLIAQQPEIRLKMRYLVVDYLLDIVNKFKLTSETFFTAVQMIDRYSSVRIIKKSQFQLVGLCCLWISSKFHEKKQNVPTLDDLTKLCCNCYSKKLFVNMETHILSSIGWCVGTNVEEMLDILIQKNKLFNAADIKLSCLYICQLVQFSKISLNYKASQITCAALSLSLRALNGYQPSLDELEMSLLKLLCKPCPSSMVDQSLHTAIVQLKKFYQFKDQQDEAEEDRLAPQLISHQLPYEQQLQLQHDQYQYQRHEQQLLTPPSSASGSIDAGVKYVPTTPLYSHNNVPGESFETSATSASRSMNIHFRKIKDIYPSPVEAVTPTLPFGMKRSYETVEPEILPRVKKVRYGAEDDSFFYEI